MDDRKKGKIKSFNRHTNYGFITPVNGGKDVYLNRKETGSYIPKKGDLVEYSLEKSKRQNRAFNVILIERKKLKEKGVLL